MKNTLIILFGLLFFSNCSKTDYFDISKDFNGTWERTNDGRKDLTLYEINCNGNNGGIDITILHTYFPTEINPDWASVSGFGYSFLVNGSQITLYNSYFLNENHNQNKKPIGDYFVISNKEKNKIILRNTKNKSEIILVKQ